MNIALYYHSLESVGGIESVVSELYRIFNGSERCIVFTDTEIRRLRVKIGSQDSITLPVDNSRAAALAHIIRKNSIDWLILNDPGSHFIYDDIRTCHENNCKVALTIHFSFNAPVMFNEAARLYQTVCALGRHIDALACVSEFDTCFWSALGMKAFHVQNPFVQPKDGDGGANDSRVAADKLLWVGRGVDPKRPEEALRIFKAVRQKLPSATLTMVGVGDSLTPLKNMAFQLGIIDGVEFVGSADDMSVYYSQADLLLVTSVLESFCLVIAEARYYGLPVAMYDLPYLDLTRSRQGLITSDYGERTQLADKIIDLLNDKVQLRQLGMESTLALSGFGDIHVYNSWMNLFNGRSEQNMSFDGNMLAKEIVKTWNQHIERNEWKIQFCDAMNKIFRGKFYNFVKTGRKYIYHPLVKLKRRLR